MSTNINLPVLLAQLPHLAKLTSAEQTRPDTQAAFSQRLAREEEKRRQESVEEVEKQDRPKAVGDEKRKDHRRDQRMRERERKADEEKEDAPAPSKSPWSGNIINRKI
ncbi:hypothetical protein GGQ74_000693 [Desulfobaculum xiamenense]|uniref:Uncharacterized protein n=1 Tax=Desulfobaculum xiamenense TaxID=995050 RepID=A0A846QLI8_9BACT|nr:hypothetical protein [Desulfobaculum xiamenense]NJB67053.1 hypothetical protein [Desulfobaculum xiamenense]